MKKYIHFSILLTLAGLTLSAILLFKHIFPNISNGFLACGSGIVDTCVAVSQSQYGTLLGIPWSAHGLVFYTFLTINLALILRWESIEEIILGILLTLEVLAATIDIYLGYILINSHTICSLCVMTYIVNLLLLVTLLFTIKKYRNFHSIYHKLIILLRGGSLQAKKTALAYTIASILLIALILMFSVKLQNYSKTKDISKEKIKQQIEQFYAKPQKIYKFPKTNLYLGNKKAPLKVHIFIDFLCSACRELFKAEKFILSKYKNRIEIKYYHYPLDAKCNEFIDESTYDNSCGASYYMEIAASLQIFEQYLNGHFTLYDEIAHGYDVEKAEMILQGLTEKKPTQNKNEIERHIKNQIDFAENELLIEATPTIVINGRKIKGTPPLRLLDKIIEGEIKKLSPEK